MAAAADDDDRIARLGDAFGLLQPSDRIGLAALVEVSQRMAAGDDAGLLPFRNRAYIDDRHAGAAQSDEFGIIDVDDVGTRREGGQQAKDEEKGAHGFGSYTLVF